MPSDKKSYNMDDGNYALGIKSRAINNINRDEFDSDSNDYFKSIRHSVGQFNDSEYDIINKRYRFGVFNTSTISKVKEYLFFTKPDLNIYPRNNNNGTPDKWLQESLRSQPYWLDLVKNNPEVIYCLQDSLSGNGDHFNHLLENCVQTNLDIPGLNAEMIDTPSNLYGVNYQYHGSAESSDDSFDFSLEFRDVKGLPVYHFFRAYEDYQILKHHGVIEPYLQYVIDKVLSDQYSIFKFLVDEDGETIVYYAQLYGVKSKSLPREVFGNTTFDGGLSYSIDFNAAFFEDMKPTIISNFNTISEKNWRNKKYDLSIYNDVLGRADGRAAGAAYIIEENGKYKLKWKGDDQY